MKLVYLQWADATSPTESSWVDLEEALRWAKEDDDWIEQVGWILEENDKYILIPIGGTNFPIRKHPKNPEDLD